MGTTVFWDIIVELLKGVLRLFMNPLLYITIIFTVLLGYRRVIRERQSFKIRIHWGLSETIRLLREGWLAAFCVSLLSLLIGIVLPMEYIMLVTVLSILFVVSFYYQLASVVYPFGMAFLVLWVTFTQNWGFTLFGFTINASDLKLSMLSSIPLLIGILLIAEGMLVQKYGADLASPRLQRTARGLKAVTFLSKRLWILPVFLVIPGDTITSFVSYWPVFSLGGETYGFILFPIVIGFQQRARKMLPMYFYPQMGRTIVLLGALVFVEGIVSYFYPILGLASVLVAIIGRILISFIYGLSERKGKFAVTPQNEGVVIAAILPNSPAEAMGLQIGETIRKVNGESVHSEEELYRALQQNAAQCKIEVLDTDGEVRLRQHIVFHHDHFRIGLLLVQ